LGGTGAVAASHPAVPTRAAARHRDPRRTPRYDGGTGRPPAFARPSADPEDHPLARSPFHRVAIVALVVAALATPALVRAQSTAPSPGATPASPAPSGPVDPGAPPAGWATGICTAYTRLAGAPEQLVAMGQAALAGDPDALGVAAINAGLLGDSALQAMDGLGDAWSPGSALAGYLNATGFALVDVGVALAQTDLADPDALRTGLGNSIAALDGWSRVTDEMALLQDRTGFDCIGVPIASPEPPPSAAPATPEPSFVGDAELLSRFPKEIDGAPITPSSRTGAELLATSDPNDTKGQQSLTDLATPSTMSAWPSPTARPRTARERASPRSAFEAGMPQRCSRGSSRS